MKSLEKDMGGKIRAIWKKEWAYLLCLAINFYGLPGLAKYTENGNGLFMILLVMAAVCFACGVVKGVREGMDFLFLGSIPLLFIPTICFYYNETAWIYSFLYLGIAGIGNMFGFLFYRFNT